MKILGQIFRIISLFLLLWGYYKSCRRIKFTYVHFGAKKKEENFISSLLTICISVFLKYPNNTLNLYAFLWWCLYFFILNFLWSFAHISIHVLMFVITLWMYCILSCVFVFWRHIIGESLDKPGKMEVEGENEDCLQRWHRFPRGPSCFLCVGCTPFASRVENQDFQRVPGDSLSFSSISIAGNSCSPPFPQSSAQLWLL